MPLADGNTTDGIGEALTITDIAKRADVGVSAVSNWRKRYADFPQSTMASGQELFASDEIAHWLGKRKIARNGLRPDEAPGTTYGDRFIRNGVTPIPGAQMKPSPGHAMGNFGWTSQLWQIMDLLRTDLEAPAALDFILAMLHIRTSNREVWHVITREHSWAAVDRILHEALFWEHEVPLFVIPVPDLSGQQQLLRAVRLFEEIDLDSVGPAALFDALLERVNRGLGRHGGYYTPPSVVRCMVEILDPKSTNTVFDPFCGSGELLVAAVEHGAGSVSGQAMNGRSLRMARFNLSMHDSEGELQISGHELKNEALADEQYDIVLSNPPFNMTLPDDIDRYPWPFEVPTKRASSFVWLQIAVNKLKPGGRACVLMPNGALFAGGLKAEIRRKVVDAGMVEAIIALPAGLFADTGIAVSLWLIRRPWPDDPAPSEVLFMDAASMGATNEHAQRFLLEGEIEKIVHEYRDWRDLGGSNDFGRSPKFARAARIEEVQRNDYDLQPQRYLSKEGIRGALSSTSAARLESLQLELDELTAQAKRSRSDADDLIKALRDQNTRDWREVFLGEVCNIQAGPGAVDRKRGITVHGWTPLVLPRNIKRGLLGHEDLDTVGPEISAKLAKYKLQSGDIVCARSGTLGRHGLVREEEAGWFLGPSCMRLRPAGDEIVPEFLVHYMNSSEVQLWIESESRSTVIPHISAARLRELVIPLPSVAEQRDIAAMMDLINVNIEQYRRGVSAMESLSELIFPSLFRS